MSDLESMLERNKDFAARQSAAGTLMPSLPRALPYVKAIIIGCADMRVDPAHVLGIKPGEAVVIRTLAVESRRGCWSSWVCSGESVRLLERFREAAGSFT
jgi:carbonic anhydrase